VVQFRAFCVFRGQTRFHFSVPDLFFVSFVVRECKEAGVARPAEIRPIDEHANLITHALGLLLSVIASAVLMTLVIADHQAGIIFACGTYCLSLMGLYAASTLSHLFHDLARRRFYRTLDQACIYLLIAGSFTPVAVRFQWPVLLSSMWVLAIFGVVLVLRMGNLTGTAKFTYGILGWLPVVSLKAMFDVMPLEMLAWTVAGGLFYSVGTIFLRFDRHVRYLHALWHAFVIAGSTCHYIAILYLVNRS
jgi:hemolysin III